MDKKDIYEHLAKIYLDASQKKKKKRKKHLNLKNIVFIGVAFFLGASIFIFSSLQKGKRHNAETALFLSSDAVKMNFNFDPAKKEVYSIDLNRLDLTRFKALGFSIKKANFQDTISVRVEFASNFRERSELYVTDLPYHWEDYKITFAEFKKISDWSEMSNLSFAVEEWNAKENKGVIYIDNIRLIK